MGVVAKKNMETITFTKKEYSELLEVKETLDRLLKRKRKIVPAAKDSFFRAFGRAFGILKDSFKDDSVDYVSKLRKDG